MTLHFVFTIHLGRINVEIIFKGMQFRYKGENEKLFHWPFIYWIRFTSFHLCIASLCRDDTQLPANVADIPLTASRKKGSEVRLDCLEGYNAIRPLQATCKYSDISGLQWDVCGACLRIFSNNSTLSLFGLLILSIVINCLIKHLIFLLVLANLMYCSDDPILGHAQRTTEIVRTINSDVSMKCDDGYNVDPSGTNLKMTCTKNTADKGKWVENGHCKCMLL